MRCASQNTPPLEFSGCHQKISSWVIYWDYAIFLGGSLNFTLSISSGAECSSDGARSTWLFSPLGAPFALTHVYCALLLLHCILPLAHTLVCLCVSVCSSFRWQHCALCAFSPRNRLLLQAHFCILHSAILYLHCICIHISAQVHCGPLGGASCYKAHFCSRVTAFYISFSLLSLCISLLLQVSDQSGAGVSFLKIIIFRLFK